MNKLKYLLLACLFLSTFLFTSSCKSDSKIEVLSTSFETPSSASHPGAFWCWLNGNMSKERITYDLENMKLKGINRAEIWDVAAMHNSEMIPGGKGFMNDESVDLIKHAIAEARRLHMTVGMVASSGWNAGGTWVKPDWASKALYHSEKRIKGPKKISIELPLPELPETCPRNADKTPVFSKEVAVVAVPFNEDKMVEPSKVINLKDHYSNGILNWDVPEGDWSVIRFICSNTGQYLIVPTPNSSGLFIDFLDPEATKRHLQYFMDRLGVTRENASEKGLDYYEFDSMELAEGTPWTDNMPNIFQKLRGYSLEEYYPIFAGWKYKNNSDKTFMYDFKQTVSDQLIFSHYVTGKKFLEEYDAGLVAESGGPGPPIWDTCPVEALKALGCVTVPRGEFWIKNRNMFLVKEIASAAHIYGKKLVDAESFTTWRRWLDSPFELKKHLDRAFCEGLTNVTFHTFASTNPKDGYPGRTYHAGIDINTGTTWWQKSTPFMNYISRCCEMLKKGLFVADVCYYYGDVAPNFYPKYHDVPDKPRVKGLGNGYDFDVVNTDVILNRMKVENGRIVLPDSMSYSLLVLKDSKEMTLEVLKKINSLVDAGATVLGTKPEVIPNYHNDEDEKEFKSLVDKLWNNGKVLSGVTPDEVLQQKGIGPDFTCQEVPSFDYIHRTFNDTEIYFVRNSSEETKSGNVKFRVNGKNAEVWNPVSGKQYSVKGLKKGKNSVEMKLELPAHGSAFVVFSDGKRNLPEYELDVTYKDEQISSSWIVNFDEKWGGPKESVFKTLQSWSESEEDGIKYYSGTAVYNNKIIVNEADKGKDCILDLGDVCEVAEVYVNGQSAGILWNKPYKVDISKLLKVGENTLKIEVINMWANRLTGDLQLPVEKRFCWTNQPWGKTDLLPSGLLGPVKLRYKME